MNPVALALLIAAGGGLGSALRFVVDHSVPDRVRQRFPWGTMVVNLSGSFVLGLLTGVAVESPWLALAGIALTAS